MEKERIGKEVVDAAIPPVEAKVSVELNIVTVRGGDEKNIFSHKLSDGCGFSCTIRTRRESLGEDLHPGRASRDLLSIAAEAGAEIDCAWVVRDPEHGVKGLLRFFRADGTEGEIELAPTQAIASAVSARAKVYADGNLEGDIDEPFMNHVTLKTIRSAFAPSE